MPRTTISLNRETMQRMVHTRGIMEYKDGKRRSLSDVINELIDYYEEGQKIGLGAKTD